MLGIPKNWIQTGKHTAAGLGAAANLFTSSVPAVVKSNTDLTKQYGDYSKKVRLPETRREIDRAIRNGTNANNDCHLAGSQQITRKDLKNLKNK